MAVARRLDHGDEARERRFPAAGFADDRERLPGLDGERRAGERLHDRRLAERAAADGVVPREVDRLDDRAHAASSRALRGIVAERLAERGRLHRRHDLAAEVGGEIAARVEEAAVGPVALAGHDAGDGRKAVAGGAVRQRIEERDRIGVMRVREEAAHLLPLHLLPGILHDDAMRRLGDDAHDCA